MENFLLLKFVIFTKEISKLNFSNVNVVLKGVLPILCHLQGNIKWEIECIWISLLKMSNLRFRNISQVHFSGPAVNKYTANASLFS